MENGYQVAHNNDELISDFKVILLLKYVSGNRESYRKLALQDRVSGSVEDNAALCRVQSASPGQVALVSINFL